MKLSKVRIKNLRSFEDAEIPINSYTCMVGANGAGKSTVLCALNVFFRETENSSTDMTRLDREDFFQKKVDNPIEITVTFTDLSLEAQEDFKDYYRNGQLIVTAKAVFNPETERADVRQYGNRLGFEAFRPFFEALGDGANATDLKTIYASIRENFPDLAKPGSKDAMVQALREYEAERPDDCVLIPSDDQFYGFSKGGNKLAKYIQWVYIPAVKDAASEQIEAKDTALGKLLGRTVRAKTNFNETVHQLRNQVREQYQKLLDANQDALNDLSGTLKARLTEWAHPDAQLALRWRQDPEKSVKVEEPLAHVMAGEGEFLGELTRLGHGLQRSYVIALLQELAVAGGAAGPRLILACEEPELYQHPPQARYLADVLRSLSRGNAQVMISTHSPFFISGEAFEDVRVVHRDRASGRSEVASASYNEVAALLAIATGKPALKREGTLAKVHQALQPALSEMFFTPRLILVEGFEDIAYIHTYLQLLDKWSAFRRAGCHIVPTNKKSEMLQPLAIARRLKIPTFAIFDSDATTSALISNETKRQNEQNLHRRDNSALLKLCSAKDVEPLPQDTVWGTGFVMWHSNIGDIVESEIGAETWASCQAEANKDYAHAGDLKKNTLHIGASLTYAWEKGANSISLERLIAEIEAFAFGSVAIGQDTTGKPLLETAA